MKTRDILVKIESAEVGLGAGVYGVAGTLQNCLSLTTPHLTSLLKTLPSFNLVYGVTEIFVGLSMMSEDCGRGLFKIFFGSLECLTLALHLPYDQMLNATIVTLNICDSLFNLLMAIDRKKDLIDQGRQFARNVEQQRQSCLQDTNKMLWVRGLTTLSWSLCIGGISAGWLMLMIASLCYVFMTAYVYFKPRPEEPVARPAGQGGPQLFPPAMVRPPSAAALPQGFVAFSGTGHSLNSFYQSPST